MSGGSRANRAFNGTVAASGLPWLVRKTTQRRFPTVLCYHDPSPETLRAHLAWLSTRYRFVTLREIVGWLRGEGPDLPPAAISVTMDDGWAGNARLRAACEEFGVTPTVFVCTGIVGTRRRFWWEAVEDEALRERVKQLDDTGRLQALAGIGFDEHAETEQGPASALSIAQLHELCEWADVQAHTRLHPVLPRCSEDRAWAEIAGSREDLEAITGSAQYAFAYPNGDYGPREEEMAAEAGFACALTIDAGFVHSSTDPYRIPRIGVWDKAETRELAAKVSGLHGMTRRVLARTGLVRRRH